MYKLIFFVPEAACESVKSAVFASGAGRLGNYSECSWQVLGEGQFRPLENANPFIGDISLLERVEEYRVEILCEPGCIKDAVAALKKSHPYEEPAYEVIKLEAF